MQEQARLTVTEAQIRELLNKTSVGYHEKVHIEVSEDGIRLLAGSPDSSSGAYVDVDDEYVEDVDGAAEAYLDVAQVQSYLSVLADGTSQLDLLFKSTSSDGLAERLVIEPVGGDGEVSLMLKSGKRAVEEIPKSLPSRFDSDNNFINPVEERPALVSAETFVEEMEQIVDAVDLQESIEYYPIVFEEDEFVLDVGDERNERVSVSLRADVENNGDDSVENMYGGSFEDVVGELDGSIEIQVEAGAPVLLLQDDDSMTVRHVIGTAKAV